MRARLATSLTIICTAACATFATQAFAGMIADENAKPGTDWAFGNDGTAAGAGVIDVYPGNWSIKQGDTINLKVRSTAGYTVDVYRLGWYQGHGARLVKEIAGQAADPQPYPTPDATFGLAAAGWHDSVVVATDSSWTPGVYLVQATQGGTNAYQAATVVIIRDDALATKLSTLFLVSLNTHQAYNCWPGTLHGLSGKSLYGFNSSPSFPTETIGMNQAVKISYDRPLFVGFGTADVTRYEYPMIRFLESKGYDVAYVDDIDITTTPQVMFGRNIFVNAGHSEYWSRDAYDSILALRDKTGIFAAQTGITSFFFATGDTINWQIRYEDGGRTMVGYKENYSKDPLEKAATAALKAGDTTTACADYMHVSFRYRDLDDGAPAGGTSPCGANGGSSIKRPGIYMTGVQTAGQILGPLNDGNPPWADFQIDVPSFWTFAGTECTGAGATIKNVMGYEVDSAATTDSYFDPWRPPGQRRLGAIVQSWDGANKGSAAYVRAASGAEVVSMGAIAFSWALDPYAAKQSGAGDTTSACGQAIVTNAFTRWMAGTVTPPPPPPPDGGVLDSGTEPPPCDPDHPELCDGGVGDAGAGDGAVVDTGVAVVDSGVVIDSSIPGNDAGPTTDTGTENDSATEDDGSTGHDAIATDDSSTTGEADSTTTTPPTTDDSGGCSFGNDRSQTASSALAIAFGALGIALVARRRRR